METVARQKTDIRCAFCRGTGRDPFGIMSALSTCCVCGGTGTVLVETPYVRCAFCRGSGVYPHSRQTCTACGGTGVSPVHQPTRSCPRCLGTGIALRNETGFYCLTCHGAGMVEEESKSDV